MILTQDHLKKIITYKAVEYVESDMVLGLGTGSTVKHVVDRFGDLLRQGKLKNIIGIPMNRRIGDSIVRSHSHLTLDLAIVRSPISIEPLLQSLSLIFSLILSNLFFFLFSESV
ncbi:hypothetical protein K1719_033029 [Acacia pycnantha]|nr:hypothetical protein K1719_033029 [Acacia pycnantha]